MRKRIPLALAFCGALALGACSSGGSSSSSFTPKHVTGLTGLGATTANWKAVHQPGSAPDSYGPVVATGAGNVDTYTKVTTAGGHVTGWEMAFASGTHLGTAEALVRKDLPPDAAQTASWRGTVGKGPGVCEVVNFESKSLSTALASNPGFPHGTFGVSFFQQASNGSVAPNIVHVNRALVGVPAAKPQSACPT